MIRTQKNGEWFEITIPKEWTIYNLQELFQTVWHASKKQTHSLRMEKNVKINGEIPVWTSKLQFRDRLEIRLFTEKEFQVKPAYHDINILYEDDHILVINKPANMDTHPNSNEQLNTLANAVAFYLQSKGEFREIKHIHRLDRDTTGTILFSKHPFIGSILDDMLEKREIKRTYIAIVQGILSNRKGTINKPIGRDRHHATRRRVSNGGQSSITHYEVLSLDYERKLSFIKCQLETGRTHQIRVHFNHIGHPLAGDLLYGGTPIFPRQALHAVKLEFIHPFTNEVITCYAPFLDKKPIFTGIDPYSI